MSNKVDPLIQKLHSMCRKDDIIMNQLIAGTMSWADVPSDDDVLELEGWKAYAEVHHRAKSAYHRTIRSQKAPVQRATVKQVPMGRKSYHIMKQEQTKTILSNGRITPVKEVIDVVVQVPVEYEEVDMDVIAISTNPIEIQVEKPVEICVEPPIEIQEETKMVAPVTLSIDTPQTPSQLKKRPIKEKFTKKKYVPAPIIYQPSFTSLYILPLLPYMGGVLLLAMVLSMRL